MSLRAACPRCPTPLTEEGTAWHCAQHGQVWPLWRAQEASYDAFAAHLSGARGFPTYLPWPLALDWRVTDFGAVRAPSGAQACVVSVAGATALDGPVEITVISEEPGTGLGARCAGTIHSDPGLQIAASQPALKVRLDGQPVPLWVIDTDDSAPGLERSVVAGEARGRWLWLVLRPASAMFLLTGEWELADVSGLGAPLLELPFGGPPPSW